MKRNSKGFTLIEFMIILAIVGILVSIAAPKAKEFMDRVKHKNDYNYKYQPREEQKAVPHQIVKGDAPGEFYVVTIDYNEYVLWDAGNGAGGICKK